MSPPAATLFGLGNPTQPRDRVGSPAFDLELEEGQHLLAPVEINDLLPDIDRPCLVALGIRSPAAPGALSDEAALLSAARATDTTRAREGAGI